MVTKHCFVAKNVIVVVVGFVGEVVVVVAHLVHCCFEPMIVVGAVAAAAASVGAATADVERLCEETLCCWLGFPTDLI